jgi:hypothetical protein
MQIIYGPHIFLKLGALHFEALNDSKIKPIKLALSAKSPILCFSPMLLLLLYQMALVVEPG